MTKKSFMATSIYLVLLVFFASSFLPDAVAKKKKSDVLLSTVDIRENYEILGIVSFRSNELDHERIHVELKKQARSLGADYVVGITYFSYSGYLYGAGTAVKIIEKKDKNQ